MEVFQIQRPDLAIIDYRLFDGTAIELLPRLREIDVGVPLLVLTAHGTIDLAVQAIKQGAEQFLTKPIELPALLVIVQRLLDNRRLRRKQAAGAVARTAVGSIRFSAAAGRFASSAIRRIGSSISTVPACRASSWKPNCSDASAAHSPAR